MLGEGIDQHLLVLRPTTHQRTHDAGGLGIFQRQRDVGIADAARQRHAFELQPQHGRILDVNDQQVDAGRARHQIGHAAVPALQLALVKGRDAVAQSGQRSVATDGLALQPHVIVLRL